MPTIKLQEADNRLQGRLALVTGASGGIGSGCARALAAEGCDIALHYSSNQAQAEALATELRQRHPTQLFITTQCDLSNRDSTRALVPTLLQHPQLTPRHRAISILVANAGIGRRVKDVRDITEDVWDAVMEVNARSQFVVARACAEGMRAQRWGRVVLVGSISGKGGGLNGCHYAASKGALLSMGLNLSRLLAPEGVTVNVVSPAMVGETGMIPSPKGGVLEGYPEDVREEDPGLAIAASVPVHRLGKPEEVANVVVMFAKTGYLTGQEVVLAGGLM